MGRPPISRSRRARDRLSEPVGGPKLIASAVCFRRRGDQLLFRLVRTGDGERWTFPSGPLQGDETLPQAAARAADGKAGVTGVVAEQPLTEFRHARRSDDRAAAFLLAVQSTAPSVGEGRDPTWCDPETAREKLTEGRDPDHALEYQRVIEVAEQELR